jgi:predicted AlkP superfamily pyrophosphatase or phosphodiesterase
MKKVLVSLIVLLIFLQCESQNTDNINTPKTEKTKLVVGIVVDQMRYDYLIRFYDKYGNNGFKRLMNDGFNCENVHLNYVPTHTAVGHTSIYTGTTPNIHGIIANNWYDKYKQKMIYCVDDKNYSSVGTEKGGEKSPHRLKSTTMTDQLHFAQNQKGKVIGMSLKDRGAILPVGHTANAAYWFRGKKDGKFITSTYYMDSLPKWVNDFNASKKLQNYLSKPWNTLYDINTYTESIADDNKHEGVLKGEEKPVFPHDLPSIFEKRKNYTLINSTPFGNSFLLDFAKASITGENLGTHNATDFLSISLSSTDYIGHRFGLDSKEVEDTYLRLDKDLETFIDFLDKQVGENNYTLFLTADHGVLASYSYLNELKIPSRFIKGKSFKKDVEKITLKLFNSTEIVEKISNFQLFLNRKELSRLKLKVNDVANILVDELINLEGVYKSVTARTLQTTNFTSGIMNYTQNGYNQKLSGDVILIPQSGTVFYHEKGSEHSTGYNYDTHIPLLFYGNGIKKGKSIRHIPVIDIAPTISSLLKIEFPSGNSGHIIEELFK